VLWVAILQPLCLHWLAVAVCTQDFAFVSIGVDYFQILAMFGNANVKWPPAILTLFRIMSSFSFNLDITAPECSMPNLSYASKWCVSVPLVLTSLFVVCCCRCFCPLLLLQRSCHRS
jgi:hypothetical protein